MKHIAQHDAAAGEGVKVATFNDDGTVNLSRPYYIAAEDVRGGHEVRIGSDMESVFRTPTNYDHTVASLIPITNGGTEATPKKELDDWLERPEVCSVWDTRTWIAPEKSVNAPPKRIDKLPRF